MMAQQNKKWAQFRQYFSIQVKYIESFTVERPRDIKQIQVFFYVVETGRKNQ
jgi:hypothetical protein